MLDVIKLYLIPGSLSLLMLSATAAVALIVLPWPRWRRAGRLLLFVTVGAYWVFSLPVFSRMLQEGWRPSDTRPAIACLQSDACGLVALASGTEIFRSGDETMTAPMPQTALNALTAAKLARSSAGPVIASGGGGSARRESEGDVVASLLREHGVSAQRIIVESESLTTREQAGEVARIARARGLTALVLVSSPAHVRRAVASVRAAGMPAFGYPANFRSSSPGRSREWLPSLGGWGMTRDAAYEYLAFGYYWSRGWLEPAK